MYFPTIINPGAFTVQTQPQQDPFYFGGSNVPSALGGVPKIKPITKDRIKVRKFRKR